MLRVKAYILEINVAFKWPEKYKFCCFWADFTFKSNADNLVSC